jgi:hypothetical protein
MLPKTALIISIDLGSPSRVEMERLKGASWPGHVAFPVRPGGRRVSAPRASRTRTALRCSGL